MRKFIVGLTLGIAIGSATTALAAQMVGEDGYLFGYSVLINGDTICYDPWIWTSTQEIECS